MASGCRARNVPDRLNMAKQVDQDHMWMTCGSHVDPNDPHPPTFKILQVLTQGLAQ